MSNLLRQRAPVIANGGFVVIDDLMSPSTLASISDEAFHQSKFATEQSREQHDISGYRTGNPARWLRSAIGGSMQSEIYHSTTLADNISYLCGQKVKPTGASGTYSYYDAKGHFLGLHRDIDTCDVTLLTCVHRRNSSVECGALRLYFKSYSSKLSEIVDNPDVPFVDIHARQGQSVILLGGWIPHEVLPADQGFERFMSVLCFKMIRS